MRVEFEPEPEPEPEPDELLGMALESLFEEEEASMGFSLPGWRKGKGRKSHVLF